MARTVVTSRTLAGSRTVVTGEDEQQGTPIGLLLLLTSEITVAGSARAIADTRTAI